MPLKQPSVKEIIINILILANVCPFSNVHSPVLVTMDLGTVMKLVAIASVTQDSLNKRGWHSVNSYRVRLSSACKHNKNSGIQNKHNSDTKIIK